MKIFIIFLIILFSCTGKNKSSDNEKKVILENIKIIENIIKNDTTGNITQLHYNELIKNYNRYVYSYPKDSLSAEFIFKSANLYFFLKRPDETIKMINKLEKNFPAYHKIPMCLILKAETYLELSNDTNKAISVYKEFLSKYPKHPLAKDIKIYLENIGNISSLYKSNENLKVQ